MEASESKLHVKDIIKRAFSSENYINFEVELENFNEFLHLGGDIFKAKVSFQDESGKREIHNIVVKLGKTPINADVSNILLRESYFYDKIIPTFQKELKIQNSKFNLFPHCLKTMLHNDYEIIILKDLNKEEYKSPKGNFNLFENNISIENINNMLKNLAKLHALSFALQHQNSTQFQNLTANINGITPVALLSGFADAVDVRLEKVKMHLKNQKKINSLKKYEKLQLSVGLLLDILSKIPEHRVICHGDYHMHNLMYKYENEISQTIADIITIDYQTSGVHSPILDLSHFFYASLSSQQFSLIKSFMDYYYLELSLSLKELNCDVEKLYPYSIFLEQWKIFSCYSVVWWITLLPILYLPQNQESFDIILDKALKSEEVDDNLEYQKKLVEIVEIYLNYMMNVK